MPALWLRAARPTRANALSCLHAELCAVWGQLRRHDGQHRGYAHKAGSRTSAGTAKHTAKHLDKPPCVCVLVELQQNLLVEHLHVRLPQTRKPWLDILKRLHLIKGACAARFCLLSSLVEVQSNMPG